MFSPPRFSFWKVFWVVSAVYLLFLFIGLFFSSFSTDPAVASGFSHLWSWGFYLRQAASIAVAIGFHYVWLNLLYAWMQDRRSWWWYTGAIVVAFVALMLYTYIYGRFSTRSEQAQVEKMPALLLFVAYALSNLFTIFISSTIAYLTKVRDDGKQRKELLAQKLQLEKEKTEANFNFLKAQINPHFLHNTLNFLYAKALPLDADLSEGILTLSDIMRYALNENVSTSGQALLKDEIEHVRNVIKINQLRYSGKLAVNVEVHGAVNGKEIIPFVLITLVENAFKHGDLKRTDAPIDIQLHIEEDRIRFRCHNRKKSGPKELSTGIGLDNIRKRLALAYPGRHTFTLYDKDDYFTATLEINA